MKIESYAQPYAVAGGRPGTTIDAERRRGLLYRLRLAPFALGAAFSLTPWASPASALALGMALALTLDNPMRRLGSRVSQLLLQASVVLLGFSMDLGVVLRTGESGMAFAAGTIVATFILGYLLAVWLKIDRKTSVLISAGTAICGGSAIAAVGSSVNADHGEMSVAMGTVFLLNAVALYAFPLIGHALGLSQTDFGIWAGVAIHDISSVVGAASAYGLSALQTATAVKLSRALWILPVATVAALAFNLPRSKGSENAYFGFDAEDVTNKDAGSRQRKTQIPWFIALFLLASVARSFSPQVAAAAPMLGYLAEIGLTLTLFLIGANLSRATLKAVGMKPLVQGIILWLVISASSLFIILRVG